jgi:N-sulfoglucosamine sulfohydrolase
MNRHQIPAFVLLMTLLGVFAGPGANGQALKGKKPNIIFIIADDVSQEDIGCYGNAAVRTPNIDKIAKQGIRFENAYLTTSSCSPSRNSIISGRYPHNTGAAELHTPLPAAQIPFPLLLKESGYYTVQAGKSHFGTPALRAFDKAYEGREGGTGGEERWVKCLQERPRDKPVFAWFAAMDAHRPWQADDFATPHDPAKVIVPPYLADTEATRQDIASYYNEIARFDFYIGEVVAELERQGIAKNTLILILADNGRPFPRSKSRVYDSGMKTPFIVKWENGITRPGSSSKSLVSVLDIAPTLLEVAGLAAAPAFQGRSFTKLLQDPTRDFRQYVFAEHNWHDYEAHERMVRSKNLMYVLNSRPQLSNHGPADSNSSPAFADLKKSRDEGKLSTAQQEVFRVPRPKEELYDCNKDPLQLRNVAALPEYQQELKALRATLANWRTVTRDNTPQNLTPDWFDRETGKPLEKAKRIRGEMPGVKAGALKATKAP